MIKRCFCPRQVLTKKLDSLEEFRQQKEQLMNKFEKLESDSKQKMDDYEKRLYDLEKSHIREQDRLKVRLELSTFCSRQKLPMIIAERDDGEG